MNTIPELSVFFPAYNEEANIEKTVRQALAVCEKITQKFEIIIINDGSRDNTQQVAERLAEEDPHIRIITHNPNRGYGAALKSGIYGAQYQYIAFNDGDGQFDFSEIEKFIPHLDHYKMVVGYRIKRVEGLKRFLIAKALWVAVFCLFQLRVKDIDCAFKVFHREILDNITPLKSEGAIISTELLVKTQRAGYAIKQVPVNHLPRLEGKPTGSNPKVMFKALIELLKLRGTL